MLHVDLKCKWREATSTAINILFSLPKSSVSPVEESKFYEKANARELTVHVCREDHTLGPWVSGAAQFNDFTRCQQTSQETDLI